MRVHANKATPGAVASLSVPWGEHRGDEDILQGAYHLVWPRDLVNHASGLLAAGDTEHTTDIIAYLRNTQEDDGHWPQNMWLSGSAFWTGVQLDQTAQPILLADAMVHKGVLSAVEQKRLWPMVRKAAQFLAGYGPATELDRWEEKGGYNAYTSRKVWSRHNLLDSICTSLAGRAAELLVFGPELSSSGAESDLRKATETAARMLRHLGHGSRVGRSDVSRDSDDNLCTDVEATNAPIEALLQAEHDRATRLMEEHRDALLALVDELINHGQVTPARFATVVGLPLGMPEDALDPYADRLASFREAGVETRGRMRA
jgi:hypothetical protein